ncbi:MAG: response regulator [Pleurocapsa sp. SU_5_0]|nr:response regulator [Pleurocapsa sp. SU_5_0]NJO96823.1 response regulator [Pleurocapsa sp. CRU_1_2]NJR46397.1 response regulator [Hyellaceae cyanobacterium CSU_1_1]
MLDIILPKLNGIEFCKRLRSAGNQTPVLLLTAQNSSDKKVIGLDAGADDYVVKPFEITELLARIRVLLRRTNSLLLPVLQWRELSLNSSIHEVVYQEKILNLTPKEYRLLELFLRSSDLVLTKEMILDRLWDIEEAPSENAIAVHIKDLRRKLKQAGASTDFIETVYGIGYRLKAFNTDTAAEKREKKEPQTEQLLRQQIKQKLNTVWEKFEDVNSDRLTILEQANHAWLADSLESQLLEQAQWAAHKLAGGLGVFGFAQGSRYALEMEELLKIESKTDRGREFSELLAALKNSLKSDLEPQLNPVNQNRPVILAVDNHPQLVKQLVAEMSALDMSFQLVKKPISLKKALARTSLNAIIWDFSLANFTAKTIDEFAQILAESLPLPTILFTDSEEEAAKLKNITSLRLKIARLNHHILLQRASLDMQATKSIVKALQQFQQKVAKILVVDDDPQILATIKNLLNPLNIDLTVLDKSLDLWQIIPELKPDLLILDVAMPDLNGIELCQLLRNDCRWQELPILFLTIHNDLTTVQEILRAGGNDCISKTQTSSQLVPKIFNHLNRGQLLTSLVS